MGTQSLAGRGPGSECSGLRSFPGAAPARHNSGNSFSPGCRGPQSVGVRSLSGVRSRQPRCPWGRAPRRCCGVSRAFLSVQKTTQPTAQHLVLRSVSRQGQLLCTWKPCLTECRVTGVRAPGPPGGWQVPGAAVLFASCAFFPCWFLSCVSGEGRAGGGGRQELQQKLENAVDLFS